MILSDETKELLDLMPCAIGLYASGAGHEAIYTNKAFFNLIGYTDIKHTAACCVFDVCAFKEDAEMLSQAVNALVPDGDAESVTCRLKNGRQDYIWVRVKAVLKCLESGEVILCCSYEDADEQMRAKIAFDKERKLWQLAMQAAKLSSWEYDMTEKRILQTAASQLQHGYGTVVENVPASIIEDGFVHPCSVDAYRRLFDAVDAKDKILQGDMYVKTADRKGYWWERIIMMPVFDSKGNHVSSIGVSYDITEQKAIEAKYERQIQIFHAANSTELIGKGLYNLSRNTVDQYYRETNDAVLENEASSYENGLLATANSFVNENEAEKFKLQFNRYALIRQYKAGIMEATFEYQRKAASGDIIWAQTSGKLYSEPISGDVMCFIYSYNINEQQTAKQMIETVVKIDYDYLALLDCRTGKYVIYANNEAVSIQLPSLYADNYEEEIVQYARKYLVAEDIESILRDMSIQNICSQLEDKELFVSYASMREPSGEISRKKFQFSYLDRLNSKVLITRVDITDVYEREQRQMKKLQAANSAKTDFLSNMSHDLRTPMNAIIGLSELAQNEAKDIAAIKSYVHDIQSAGQFLLGLVNDCLDFEKLSEHKMKLHPVQYTYDEFRESIMTMIKPLCVQKNITFNFEEAEPYTVYIDKVRFEQIFFNLLSNSVKYTQHGGTIDFMVKSSLSDDGQSVRCDYHVRDNGIGMSKEFQAHLFEPFEQETTYAHTVQQSTGLGLSIVHELVALMGGTINIVSSLGVGTEVVVHLEVPNMTRLTQECKKTEQCNEGHSLAGKNILLLEDHPLNMTIARKLLEKHDMKVMCAENGEQGLEMFKQSGENYFDAVLSDIRMPVMNGLELARAIRALPREDASAIPIIAMTANAFEEDVQKSREAGMNEHLSKPIAPELLYSTLERCIFKDTQTHSVER